MLCIYVYIFPTNVGNISQKRISRPIAFCRVGHILEKSQAETVHLET